VSVYLRGHSMNTSFTLKYVLKAPALGRSPALTTGVDPRRGHAGRARSQKILLPSEAARSSTFFASFATALGATCFLGGYIFLGAESLCKRSIVSLVTRSKSTFERVAVNVNEDNDIPNANDV